MARKRRVRTVTDLRALSEEERAERRRALRALSLARAEGWPIETAARELGLDMSAVREWVGDALGPTRGGRTYPRRTDSIVRFRPLYVEGRLDLVVANGSEESNLLAEIFGTQYRFIHGDATAADLRRYANKRISDGRLVETDPEVLKRAALEEPEIDPYRELF